MSEFHPGGAREIVRGDFGYHTEVKRLPQDFSPVDATGAPTDPADEFLVMADHGSLTGLNDITDHNWALPKAGYGGLAADVPTHTHSGGSTPAIVGARVRKTTAMTIPTSANTVVTFDAERYDSHAFHSTAVNTSRFTIPTTGYYHIGGNVRWDTNTTGRRLLAINVDGDAANPIVFFENVPNAVGVPILVACDYFLTAGQYVELSAFQNSGADRTLQALTNYSPEFWIHLIGI
jgi:hypothetical protein